MLLHVRSPSGKVITGEVNIRHEVLKAAGLVTKPLEIRLSQRVNRIGVLQMD